MRFSPPRRLLGIIAVVAVLSAFFASPAAADHEGDVFVGDIALNIPATFAYCLDEARFIDITTTGAGDRTLRGQIIVEYVLDGGARQLVPGGFYPVDQAGDINVTITIPPASQWPVQSGGTAEIHVDVQLEVFSAGVMIGNIGPGHDFDIFCLDPPPPPPPPTGDQGCTPGFWRQANHYDAWVSYTPDQLFDSVFGVSSTDNPALGDAVQAKGGGESALMRHAVAALLNAASPDVGYAFSAAEVISMVQDAYSTGDFEPTKDLFDAANNAGCPLD